MVIDQLELKTQAKARIDIEPILVNSEIAAQMCGISLAEWFRLLASGRIGPKKIIFGSKCVRFSVAQLKLWAANGAVSRREFLEMKARKL